MDKDHIDTLIALGTDPISIARMQDLAAKEMQRAGLGYTLHNACAATLSEFLRAAGIDVTITLGAGRLAARLAHDRHWRRIDKGGQIAGDVGVAFDRTDPPGADHIYLVVERIDDDAVLIADNQAPKRHRRLVSGGGKTPTEYFLRAPSDGPEPRNRTAHLAMLEHPTEDQNSSALIEPFNDDGSPALRA